MNEWLTITFSIPLWVLWIFATLGGLTIIKKILDIIKWIIERRKADTAWDMAMKIVEAGKKDKDK